MMQNNRNSYFNSFFLIFYVILLGVGARLIIQHQPRPKLFISKQDSALNFNSQLLKTFSLGHARLVSAYLWISTMIESDLEHYKKDDGNSWMSLRFNTIAALEPLFYQNYLVGGQYLSIVKDDIIGADQLYAKGLEFYPDSFWLRYNAGYNAAFEMKDYPLALRYFSPLLNDPLTQSQYPFLFRLINKIKYEAGEIQLEELYQYFLGVHSGLDEGFIKDQIRESIYAIKATIDLRCLNSQSNDHCSRVDQNGDGYFFNNGKWEAIREFKEFKLFK